MVVTILVTVVASVVLSPTAAVAEPDDPGFVSVLFGRTQWVSTRATDGGGCTRLPNTVSPRSGPRRPVADGDRGDGRRRRPADPGPRSAVLRGVHPAPGMAAARTLASGRMAVRLRWDACGPPVPVLRAAGRRDVRHAPGLPPARDGRIGHVRLRGQRVVIGRAGGPGRPLLRVRQDVPLLPDQPPRRARPPLVPGHAFGERRDVQRRGAGLLPARGGRTSPVRLPSPSRRDDGRRARRVVLRQFYRFVRGAHRGSSRWTWDCRGRDWRRHYTSQAELYCYGDFLRVMRRLRENVAAGRAIDASPGRVARAWGRA